MSTKARRSIIKGHVVVTRKQPCGRKARNSAADDGNPLWCAARQIKGTSAPCLSHAGYAATPAPDHDVAPELHFYHQGDLLGRRGRIRFMMNGSRSIQDVITPPVPGVCAPRLGGRTSAEESGFLSAETTTPTDPTLWLLAVRDRRDRAAFLLLFQHFAPRLKAMLMRGGLRDGSAEDVVQDVMLAVWHKAAQFDPHRAEASAWIYRIARNRRIDLARRKPPPEPDPLTEPEGSEPDAAHILALGQEAALLRRALEAMSPDQARVLEQAYFEDLAHSRISEMTGLPLGTVKSRIRLGLDRLRRDLNELRQP